MDTSLDTRLINSHCGSVDLKKGNNDKPGTNRLVLPGIKMFHEQSSLVRGRASTNALPVQICKAVAAHRLLFHVTRIFIVFLSTGMKRKGHIFPSGFRFKILICRIDLI